MLDPVAAASVWEWEGKAPGATGTKLFRLAKAHILEEVRITGNLAVFDDAHLVPDVIQEPASIHRGLGRSGQEGAFCYAGIPSYKFSRQIGRDLTLPPGFTFMVFVTKSLEVSKWRICEEDPHKPGFAIDHENRFGELLWPRD